MKIKYVGKAGVRRIDREDMGSFVWAADVEYAANVPADLAAELLTYPRPDFVPDLSEPLLGLVGVSITLNGDPVPFGEEGHKMLDQLQSQAQSRLAGLAMAGIGSLDELAGIAKKDIPEIAEKSGLDPKLIEGWITAAKKLKEA
jgi:hypothetical protein